MNLTVKKEISQLNTASLPKGIAIYIRVSTLKQNDNNSKDNQLASIFSLIKANGWDNVPYEIYEDTHSASLSPKLASLNSSDNIFEDFTPNLFIREGIRKLFYDASFKNFDKLIVYSHDRLSREPYESLLLKHSLNKLKIEILYSRAGEQINSNNKSIDTFLENLLSNIASLESNIIGGRTFMGNRGNIIKDLWAGGPPPYGYKLIPIPSNRKKTKLVVEPKEARIVKKIFDLYVCGYAPKNIASYIKNEYEYNKDRLWTINSIKSILSNPVYKGTVIWNKKGGRRNPRKKDSSQYTYSTYDPDLKIIDVEIWNKAKEVKEIQIKNPKFLSTNFLFKGLLICGECGQKFKTKNHGNASGNVYYCRHDINEEASKNLDTLTIKSSILNDLVFKELEDILKELIDFNNNIDSLYEDYLSKINSIKLSLTDEKESLNKELKEISEMASKATNELVELNGKNTKALKGVASDKHDYLLSSLEEFLTYLNLMEQNISLRLKSIEENLLSHIISKDNFREYLSDNLAYFKSCVSLPDNEFKNRCLRLTLIKIIHSISLKSDKLIDICFK